MKILIAMDSFKGSLTSVQACDAAERGAYRAFDNIEVTKIPMADGGEGTVAAFVAATGGTIKICDATGPFGEKIKGCYGILGNKKTAVVETAIATGITLAEQARLNPMTATSYGTGEIILKAAKDGFDDIIVGLGGSASNDGGMGALQAFGVKFFGKNGAGLGRGGEMLEKVCKIDASDISPALRNVRITLACDVKNPFYGSNGAAYVFAPQKGATAEMVKTLDNGLRNLAAVIYETNGRDISKVDGAGAAGGLCGGLLAFTNAVTVSGFEVLANAVSFDEKVKSADLIITGEGKTDMQTAYGKLPAGVANVSKKYGKKTICVSGSVEFSPVLYEAGINALFSITNKPMTLNYAIKNAETLLEETCFNIVKMCWQGTAPFL